MRRSSLRQRDGEIRVLRSLQQHPAQSLDNIAYSTNYARCTVHGIIGRLEARGWIYKEPGRGRHPNRYAVIVSYLD